MLVMGRVIKTKHSTQQASYQTPLAPPPSARHTCAPAGRRPICIYSLKWHEWKQTWCETSCICTRCSHRAGTLVPPDQMIHHYSSNDVKAQLTAWWYYTSIELNPRPASIHHSVKTFMWPLEQFHTHLRGSHLFALEALAAGLCNIHYCFHSLAFTACLCPSSWVLNTPAKTPV